MGVSNLWLKSSYGAAPIREKGNYKQPEKKGLLRGKYPLEVPI